MNFWLNQLTNGLRWLVIKIIRLLVVVLFCFVLAARWPANKLVSTFKAWWIPTKKSITTSHPINMRQIERKKGKIFFKKKKQPSGANLTLTTYLDHVAHIIIIIAIFWVSALAVTCIKPPFPHPLFIQYPYYYKSANASFKIKFTHHLLFPWLINVDICW